MDNFNRRRFLALSGLSAFGAWMGTASLAAQADAQAKRAITLVQVARRLPGFTLLDVTIKTGRTHQIRVHLASSGHPIAGDDKYGDFDFNRQLMRCGLKRMFLHAWRLRLTHPVTRESLELNAGLPAELQSFVGALQTPLE